MFSTRISHTQECIHLISTKLQIVWLVGCGINLLSIHNQLFSAERHTKLVMVITRMCHTYVQESALLLWFDLNFVQAVFETICLVLGKKHAYMAAWHHGHQSHWYDVAHNIQTQSVCHHRPSQGPPRPAPF